MLCLHILNAFGCADNAHELDLANTPALEHIGGRHGGTAGREHGIQDQANGYSRFDRQLVVVLHRLEGLFVAVQSDVPDLR